MKSTTIGRILSAILALGGLLHAYGSFLAFELGSPALVWSLGSAGFALFLAALAFYVNSLPAPPNGLVIILLAGLAAWLAVVIGFGAAIGAMADPRVLYHLVVTAALFVQLALLAGRT